MVDGLIHDMWYIYIYAFLVRSAPELRLPVFREDVWRNLLGRRRALSGGRHNTAMIGVLVLQHSSRRFWFCCETVDGPITVRSRDDV